MNSPKRRWPVLEDLEAGERKDFENWLASSQMPINSDGSQGYYPGDYAAWKRSLQQRNKN